MNFEELKIDYYPIDTIINTEYKLGEYKMVEIPKDSEAWHILHDNYDYVEYVTEYNGTYTIKFFIDYTEVTELITLDFINWYKSYQESYDSKEENEFFFYSYFFESHLEENVYYLKFKTALIVIDKRFEKKFHKIYALY